MVRQSCRVWVTSFRQTQNWREKTLQLTLHRSQGQQNVFF